MAAAAKVSKPAQSRLAFLVVNSSVSSIRFLLGRLACYAHQEKAVYANQGPSAVLSPQAITESMLTSPSHHCSTEVLLHSMRPGYILTHSCNAFFDSGGKFARPCRNLSWLRTSKASLGFLHWKTNHIKVTESDSGLVPPAQMKACPGASLKSRLAWVPTTALCGSFCFIPCEIITAAFHQSSSKSPSFAGLNGDKSMPTRLAIHCIKPKPGL